MQFVSLRNTKKYPYCQTAFPGRNPTPLDISEFEFLIQVYFSLRLLPANIKTTSPMSKTNKSKGNRYILFRKVVFSIQSEFSFYFKIELYAFFSYFDK